MTHMHCKFLKKSELIIQTKSRFIYLYGYPIFHLWLNVFLFSGFVSRLPLQAFPEAFQSCCVDHLWARPAFSHNTLLQLSLLTKMADNSSVGFRQIPIGFTKIDTFLNAYWRIVCYRLRLLRAVASLFSEKTKNMRMNGVCIVRLLSKC